MKKFNIFLIGIVLMSLTGCELAGDIFKAGAYFGIIAVFIVIALIIWLISKFRS